MATDLKERVDQFNEGFGEVAVRTAGNIAYETGKFILDFLIIGVFAKSLLSVMTMFSDREVNKVATSVDNVATVLLSEIERGIKKNRDKTRVEKSGNDIIVRMLFSVDLQRLIAVLDQETKIDLAGQEQGQLRKGLFKAVDRAFGDNRIHKKLYNVVRIYHEDVLRKSIEGELGSADFDQMIQMGEIKEVGAEMEPRSIFFGLTINMPIS